MTARSVGPANDGGGSPGGLTMSARRGKADINPTGGQVCFGPRLCDNSDVELARRNFVSITLNRKRTTLAVTVEGLQRENNFALSLLAHVFTQPRPKAACLAPSTGAALLVDAFRS